MALGRPLSDLRESLLKALSAPFSDGSLSLPDKPIVFIETRKPIRSRRFSEAKQSSLQKKNTPNITTTLVHIKAVFMSRCFSRNFKSKQIYRVCPEYWDIEDIYKFLVMDTESSVR